FFSSRRRHTRSKRDWSSDVCSSDLNCDLITSLDTYVDFMPKGVNKGSTLKKLVEYLSVEESKILVAGDTMNDLALYETGYKGVRSEERRVGKRLESVESLTRSKEKV